MQYTPADIFSSAVQCKVASLGKRLQLNFGVMTIRITDPYRDTGKTFRGGGVHCPSASSKSSVRSFDALCCLAVSTFDTSMRKYMEFGRFLPLKKWKGPRRKIGVSTNATNIHNNSADQRWLVSEQTQQRQVLTVAVLPCITTGVNVAEILGDAGVNPEGLVGVEGECGEAVPLRPEKGCREAARALPRTVNFSFEMACFG